MAICQFYCISTTNYTLCKETMSEGNERLHGKTAVKPIVYGNIAEPFGFKRESDQHTHKWTVFVKPYYPEDASLWIRKVQFKLHDSIANPTRVVEQPPYEVEETGWGEFEIQIRIYFTDPNEKPVTAFHYLRLFQPVVNLPSGKSIVVSEYYDEIVFRDPTVSMYNALTEDNSKKYDARRFHHDLIANRKRTVQMVANAKKEIQKEIEDLRESLRDAHKLIMKYSAKVDDESRSSTPNVSFSLG